MPGILPVGTVINGRYEVTGPPIHPGTMSTIYPVKQLYRKGKAVAKIADPAQSGQYTSTDLREAFERERDFLDSLAPGIQHCFPRLLDYFVDDHGCPVMILEDIPGKNLVDLYPSHHRVAEVDALDILIRLAECVKLLHLRGKVHNDLKPSNIMRRNDGVIVLLDFGTMANAGATAPGSWGTSSRPDGTPGYGAPERAAGLASFQSDIYALGVILAELLTGDGPHPLFPYSKEFKTSDIASGLKLIVYRATHRDPDDRYLSIEEMLEELHSARRELEHCSSIPHVPAHVKAPWPAPYASAAHRCTALGLMALTGAWMSILFFQYRIGEYLPMDLSTCFLSFFVTVLLLVYVFGIGSVIDRARELRQSPPTGGYPLLYWTILRWQVFIFFSAVTLILVFTWRGGTRTADDIAWNWRGQEFRPESLSKLYYNRPDQMRSLFQNHADTLFKGYRDGSSGSISSTAILWTSMDRVSPSKKVYKDHAFNEELWLTCKETSHEVFQTADNLLRTFESDGGYAGWKQGVEWIESLERVTPRERHALIQAWLDDYVSKRGATLQLLNWCRETNAAAEYLLRTDVSEAIAIMARGGRLDTLATEGTVPEQFKSVRNSTPLDEKTALVYTRYCQILCRKAAFDDLTTDQIETLIASDGLGIRWTTDQIMQIVELISENDFLTDEERIWLLRQLPLHDLEDSFP